MTSGCRDALDILIGLTQQGQTNPFNVAYATPNKLPVDDLISVKRQKTMERPSTTLAPKKIALPPPPPGTRRRGRPLGSKNAPRTDSNGNLIVKPTATQKLSSADARIIHVVSSAPDSLNTSSNIFHEESNAFQNANTVTHLTDWPSETTRKSLAEKKAASVESQERHAVSAADAEIAYELICNLIEQEFVANSALVCSLPKEQSTYNLAQMQTTLQRIGSNLEHYFNLSSLAAWLTHSKQLESVQTCISSANIVVQLLCGPVDQIDIDNHVMNLNLHEEKRSGYVCIDWSRLSVDQMLHRCNIFAILSRLEPYYNGSASIIPIKIVAMRIWQPNCWRLLMAAIAGDKMTNEMLSHLAQIVESNMLPFVEHAVSGVLFAPQTIAVAMQCCCEKIRMFERPLVDYIAQSSSPETFCLFWHSQSAIEFQRRVSNIIALQKAAQTNESLKAFKNAMPHIASERALPPMHLIDLLAEVIGRNMLSNVLQPKAEYDWQHWCEKVQEINQNVDFETLSQTCPFHKTVDWMLENIGATPTQLEMQSGNVGALQIRLQACLDEEQEPIHEQFVQHGFAVDDSQPLHRVPLPILVCYERTQPSTLDSEKDYSSVLLPSRNIFRAYGVFLYTRAPDANQSRFALMMWLSPPYAGEVVAAFTPFCQGLIDYYISCSDRTAASGYVGLKYYSASQRQFLPIDNILTRKSTANSTSGGVYNRIPNTVALELRKTATLRESKTALLALARPPPSAKTRDSHYLAYEIESEPSADEHEKMVPKYVNYVHPAAAHRLWMLGYQAAIGETPNNANVLFENAMQSEREKSKIMLATWQQNFFESDVAAVAQPKKKKDTETATEKGKKQVKQDDEIQQPASERPSKKQRKK